MKNLIFFAVECKLFGSVVMNFVFSSLVLVDGASFSVFVSKRFWVFSILWKKLIFLPLRIASGFV